MTERKMIEYIRCEACQAVAAVGWGVMVPVPSENVSEASPQTDQHT
jgi:hypothetical protein